MGLHLSQAQIDALLRVVKSSDGGARKQEAKKVQKYDFRQPKTTDSEQFSVVKDLLQHFARDLGSSAGDYLRTSSEVKISSLEQTIYREVLRSLPDLTYLSSCRILPADAPFLFQAELSLVYPILDLILGGPGAGVGEARPLTQIEEQIFEAIVNLIAASLKKACSQLAGADVKADGIRKRNELPARLPPTETILVATLDVRLGEAQGTFRFAFPSAAFDSLVRTVTSKLSPEKRAPSTELRGRIRQSLLHTRFAGQLVLPPSQVKVRELLTLEPGRVLVLPRRAQDPAALQVVGKTAFIAYPVRLGRQRGARIEKRSSVIADRKETK
jgi:flagellar motor switch protein FliM